MHLPAIIPWQRRIPVPFHVGAWAVGFAVGLVLQLRLVVIVFGGGGGVGSEL